MLEKYIDDLLEAAGGNNLLKAMGAKKFIICTPTDLNDNGCHDGLLSAGMGRT
jgi:hypothetical protein